MSVISDAIAAGGRCGNNTCSSATNSPALVYFPQGSVAFKLCRSLRLMSKLFFGNEAHI